MNKEYVLKVSIGLLYLIVVMLLATSHIGAIGSLFEDEPVVATGTMRQSMRLEELPFELLEVIPHDETGLLEDVGDYVSWFGYVVDLRDGTIYNWFLYSNGCAAAVNVYEGEDYYSWTTCPETRTEDDAALHLLGA